MVKLADEVRVIDADTHLTERHDLFTSRAPKGYEDRVPRVVDIDGRPWWVVEENGRLGPARGGGVVSRSGEKFPFEESKHNGIDWVHQAAWDHEARLEYMNQNGFHAQVLYPNALGIGGPGVPHTAPGPGRRRP